MTAKKSGSISLKLFWQLRRKRSIIVIQPPVAFLPSIRLLTPELFAKVFTDKRMRIEMPRIVRIFSQRGVLLFLIWQESFATRSGSNPSTTL